MFTGIVETTGEVRRVESDADGRRLFVVSDRFGDLEYGASVSVSGTCLTVETSTSAGFEAFVAAETAAKTHLGQLREGDAVNLERPMPVDGRFDGHVVQGHVDTTTRVTGIERVGEDWTFRFALPEGYERYVAPKGSVALDGISLTVAEVDDEAGEFSVAIVPTTYEVTTLSARSVGDPVNVEVDVLAKYVERLLDA